MPKEITVGSTIIRNRDGAVGKVVNKYLGALIVDFMDGEGARDSESVLVPLSEIGHDYKLHKQSSLLVTSAERIRAAEEAVTLWRGPAEKFMLASLTSAENPIPPSEETKQGIKDFLDNYAQDIIATGAGQLEGAGMRDMAKRYVDNAWRSRENAAKTAYELLRKDVKGTPAEAEVEAEYAKLRERVEADKAKQVVSRSKTHLAEFFGGRGSLEYLKGAAIGLWMENDIVPRIYATFEGLAKDAKVPADKILEMPVNPKVAEWGLGRELPGEEDESAKARKRREAELYNQQYLAETKHLEALTNNFRVMFKHTDEYNALRIVLPSWIMHRLSAHLNSAEVPAQMIIDLRNTALRLILAPRPGAEESRMGRNKVLYDPEVKDFDLTYPEFASVGSVSSERKIAAFRQRIVDAIRRLDMVSARKYLEQLRVVAEEFKNDYHAFMGSDADAKPIKGAGITEAAGAVQKSMEKIYHLMQSWEVTEGTPGAAKSASARVGYAQGQPVRYRDYPAVHVIVSYDESDPSRVYLIPESDINTHERRELIAASINEVTPLKVYKVANGDLLPAYGSVGRVVDASNKDIGMVFIQLRGSIEVIPFDLEQTNLPCEPAAPITLCVCEHDGGVITEDQKSSCPCGMSSAAPQESAPSPEIDSRQRLLQVLQAALETMEIKDILPAPETGHREIYENAEEGIEIGSTVQRFGSMLTGTVIGRRSAAYIVDWETGASSDCWAQELVPVIVQEDAR